MRERPGALAEAGELSGEPGGDAAGEGKDFGRRFGWNAFHGGEEFGRGGDFPARAPCFRVSLSLGAGAVLIGAFSDEQDGAARGSEELVSEGTIPPGDVGSERETERVSGLGVRRSESGGKGYGLRGTDFGRRTS